MVHGHGGAAELLKGTDQLGGRGVLAHDHVVAVHDHEGVIAGEGLGHQNGVAKAEGLLLAHKEDVGQPGNAQASLQRSLLAGLGQSGLQLGGAVKVILDNVLVAADDNQNIRDARTDSLLHNVLNGGLVHNGQHLLGHGLGGGQHTGAQAGGGDNCLTNLHKNDILS